MDTARAVIDLFGAEKADAAADIAAQLDRLNSERQKTENDVVETILKRLGDIPPSADMPCIVVEGEGWHPGVIGIVASRVVERYHRPTLVLAVDPETGLATGSGRSIPGFHLLEGLETAADIFVRFGGHRHAAGCTLPVERIPELRSRLNEHAGRVLQPEDFLPALALDADLPFREITDSLMEQIALLAPHGLGNPTPLFSASNLRLKAEPKLLQEKHLKLVMEQERVSFSAIGWRMGDRFDGLGADARLDAAFTVERDTNWGGWQLNLKDLGPAGSVPGRVWVMGRDV
jgi:single-stranded-DNA-specific exonuclease